MTLERYDAVLVGGGLHNGLIALSMLTERSDLRIALVEQRERLGGQHTWCFHAGDLPESAARFVEPLIEHRWAGYEVRFPGFGRQLSSPYAGFSSEKLHAVLTERLEAHPDCSLLLGCAVGAVHSDHVLLADGRKIQGKLVIDGRGSERPAAEGEGGFQVFVGQELQLLEPHGLEHPILMDARIPQKGGYRFFYVLPLAEDRVLIEDTRFSDSPKLHSDALRSGIADYCAAEGYQVSKVLREEEGVLPMPWTGENPRPELSPLRVGYEGGWMHPATGYSFPIAARLANLIGHLGPEACLGPELRSFAKAHARQLRFARLLNRLLFRWFEPERRLSVFERFYHLPQARIRRFYALQMTLTDRLRMIAGRPPRGFSLRARLKTRERSHEPAGL